MARIGFVGLGHMGLPMALQLLKHGHEVTGFDLQSAPQQALSEAGGHAAHHLHEAAHGQALIFTMLQTGEQVRTVCLDPDGLFAHASPQTLYIDCSSIDISTTRLLHQVGEQKHLNVLDAPVSGGIAGAQQGTLTFMVGGTSDTFQRASPYLSHMGQHIIHAGTAGHGQAAKICNNMLLGISMIAVSEAFTLAEQLGLSAQKLFEIVNQSSGQCWAMSHYPPIKDLVSNAPSSHDYQPGFTTAMMLKDLHLSQTAAHGVHLTTTLGHLATALYQQWVDEGHAELDFSSIIKLINR